MELIEKPSRAEYEGAREDLRQVVLHTPLVPLHGVGEADILLKPEIHQPAGCFKIRGIFHAVSCLSENERSRGVSTVSAGNTAKALAWTGRHFGISARSLMPESAPKTKIETVQAYGGTPVLVPTAEVFRFLREHGWEQEPYAFIHPWINRDVMIGHGSMGLEIIEDCPDVDSVFLPVGGGGLLAGVGGALRALKPSIKIFGVEPAGCPSLHASIEAKRPVQVPCETICDGVAVPYMTEEMYPILSSLVDEVILIAEHEVRATIKNLATGSHLVAEGAGALSVAAALKTSPEKRGKTVCPITGGSIDAEKLAQILSDPELE